MKYFENESMASVTCARPVALNLDAHVQAQKPDLTPAASAPTALLIISITDLTAPSARGRRGVGTRATINRNNQQASGMHHHSLPPVPPFKGQEPQESLTSHPTCQLQLGSSLGTMT